MRNLTKKELNLSEQMSNNIIKLCIMVFVLSQSGCVAVFGTKVKPEPVSFDHQDEFVKGEGFMVLADRRVFTLMAFLNAVGFDEEVEGQKMHPVRQQVRGLVAANLVKYPQKIKSWQKYRNGLVRKYLQPFSFQDFVLSLSTDYPFKRIRPDKELNYFYTANILNEFPDVLNDFWETAKLDEVWEKVKPKYIKEIKKYNFAKMREQMDFLWDYMRMERKDNFTIVNVPDLLGRHYHAIGARYENYYFSIEGPGSGGYSLNTHEYLHSIINDLVKKNYKKQANKLMKYYNAGKNTPIAKTYRNPVTFTYECLVIALDSRINIKHNEVLSVTRMYERQLADTTNKGMNLTLPFYNLLTAYEQSGESFDKFLPKMLKLLPEYNH